MTNLHELQLKDRAKKRKEEMKIHPKTCKKPQKQEEDFSRVVLSQFPALGSRHVFLSAPRFMSKVKGSSSCCLFQRGYRRFNDVQDPPCCWVHRGWVRTSPLQSDLLGAGLHLLFTAQQPPILEYSTPQPLRSPPDREAALRS